MGVCALSPASTVVFARTWRDWWRTIPRHPTLGEVSGLAGGLALAAESGA